MRDGVCGGTEVVMLVLDWETRSVVEGDVLELVLEWYGGFFRNKYLIDNWLMPRLRPPNTLMHSWFE